MSVFSKIVAGELPCYKIYETETTLSFLALDQVQPGHTLVIPKQEVDEWVDVDDSLLTEVILHAKHVSIALKKFSNCLRVGTAVVGFEVPHYHHHLIPINRMSDLDFSKGRVLPQDEMAEIQKSIVSFL